MSNAISSPNSPNSNIKIGLQMLKFDTQLPLECQNRISNVKIVCMLKQHFGLRDAIFGPNSNIKIKFKMSKFDIQPKLECLNQMSKCNIRSQFHIKIGFQMSK